MGRLFDIFVLIFCNSTASRLIYAYSHYNMCAGGGCMHQISNEKFGLFVTELRKKKNLTQKDLAEKLYVSDMQFTMPSGLHSVLERKRQIKQCIEK